MTQDFNRDQRLRFLQLDERSTSVLREFREVLGRHIDDVLDSFYSYITSWDELARLFPAGVQHARDAQKSHWMNNVFNANFGEDYMAQVMRIGKVHAEIGLEPRWYLGGYCFVLNKLAGIITQTYRRDPSKASLVLQAVNRAAFLDMDLALSIYIEESEAKAKHLLNEHANAFEASVKGMVEIVAAAATQLQATAQGMEGTANSTSQQAGTVAAAAEEASTNVQTVAAASEELSSSIAEISRQVQTSNSISQNAVSESQKANENVQGLADAAKRIGEVIKMINDIASQTNLLALNATIEAARAGEAGKGFAVVASEVKNLANQTAKATEEIGAQIASIQDETGRAVTGIEGIGNTISQISEIAATIASAVEEQGAATQEIARNVEQASSGTKEVTSHITDVSQAALETGESAKQVLAAASELSSQAEQLSSEVSRFLEDIRKL